MLVILTAPPIHSWAYLNANRANSEASCSHAPGVLVPPSSNLSHYRHPPPLIRPNRVYLLCLFFFPPTLVGPAHNGYLL